MIPATSANRAPTLASSFRLLMLRSHRMNRIENLAAVAKMSPFGFSPSIQKALISMTPLQYQNTARLLKVRRVTFSDAANVETAAFEGWVRSPCQFGREFARM